MFLSLIFTYFSKKIAQKYDILDNPKSRPDKRQSDPIPLLGGVGITFVSIFLMSILWIINKYNFFNLSSFLNQNLIYNFRLYWVLIGGLILVIGGTLDDKLSLSSKWLFLYINLGIATTVFGGGLKIETFAYPFDFILPNVLFLPQILAYIWILVCTSATKFLDGHDGLATSVSLIGFLSIASVSLFPNVYQPLIFLFALIWVSSTISFLFFNFPNANLYLGESGSEILGFMIGVLSILSGAKVATASTVIGWFILDIVVVMFLRLANKKPLFKADRTHLHHRLIDLGLNKIQVLTLIVITSITTAHTGLLFPTHYKVFVLPSQFLFLIIIIQIFKITNKKV